jgi:hypothetical protein
MRQHFHPEKPTPQAQTYLVNRIDDPVDAGILADSLVLGVDEDDLVVLVGRILVDPVRVENTQVGAAATDTFLGGGFEGALVFQLVDTLVGGLACAILLVLVLPCNKCAFSYHR